MWPTQIRSIKNMAVYLLLVLPFFSYANCSKLINDLTLKYHPNVSDKDFSFEDCKVWPEDPSKTIVVLAISKDQDINYAGFDLDVILVNNKNNKVIARNFEKKAITSDAINFTGLSIDTARYYPTAQSRAFGIRLNYHSNNSGYFPYEEQNLNLYHFHNNKLTRILSMLKVYLSGGEANDGCIGEFNKIESILSMSAKKTNDFADINVTDKRTKIKIINSEIPNECEDKIIKLKPRKFTLRYNGQKYVIPKINDR